MIQLNSVLVAFDFGETSQKALVYGQNLTRSFGGRLHVLHVADVIATTASQFYPDHPCDPEMRAEALALKHLRGLVPDGAVWPNTSCVTYLVPSWSFDGTNTSSFCPTP
jgi:nucleotide-binding universal stress UspA family protein